MDLENENGEILNFYLGTISKDEPKWEMLFLKK